MFFLDSVFTSEEDPASCEVVATNGKVVLDGEVILDGLTFVRSAAEPYPETDVVALENVALLENVIVIPDDAVRIDFEPAPEPEVEPAASIYLSNVLYYDGSLYIF